MRQVRLIPALALILGAALFISACGGDDSPETPITVPTTATTSDLGKDEFIEEADAICEEANASIGQFVAAGEGFTEAGEIADIRQGVLDDLQDLGPPEDDRRTLDDFLSALEAQVEAGEKIALANERGTDTAEFETELDNARAEAESAGAEYGFEECGAPITATDTSGTAGATDPGTNDPGAVVPAEPAPVTPAPAPAPETGGTGGTGDSGGTGDTGGDTGGGGVTPGGGGVGPG
jgi:hypothetical protein